uniref:Uncharacterized protein n=1 Tax=Amazona collaria TaxID=241587 RepID=A0A8B9J0G3_9PSIT
MSGYAVANDRLRVLEELEREIAAALQSAGGRGLGGGGVVSGRGRRGVVIAQWAESALGAWLRASGGVLEESVASAQWAGSA